jgi:alkylhydroperoxidase family enzyme
MRPPGIDGLDDEAIADVINAAAFFSWANRLMRQSASRRR